MEIRNDNKTFSAGFKKVLSMFLRYGNKKRSPYSAEEFKTVTTQFRKDKEEYLTRKTNPSRYTDERVILRIRKEILFAKSLSICYKVYTL